MEHRSTPAIAARAEPMAKVRAIVPFTLIPMSCAAPLSSETASMACPAFVFLIKSVNPVIIIMQAAIVTIVSPEIISCPSASETVGIVTTDLKDFGLALKIKRAIF